MEVYHCFVLAKKLMVTKPSETYISPKLLFCSSEKINGNKTGNASGSYTSKFCSSEKINGNKTLIDLWNNSETFCSSEKINGNKTSFQGLYNHAVLF